MGAIQTNQRELEAFYAMALPGFLEYLAAHGTTVGSVEEAATLEGITSLPARYRLGGVEKTVLAPLELLTKDVDARIADCTAATTKANAAADEATAAAAEAENAAASVDESKAEAAAAAAEATTAATNADTATTNANAATDRLTTLCDNRDKVVDGYWWHYNESTKAYENTGEIAKGNVMYATFEVTDAGQLLMYTDEEYTGANFKLDAQGRLSVII